MSEPHPSKTAKMLVESLAAGLHGQMEVMLKMGLAEDDLVAMLSNAIAGIIAHAEPAQRREQLTTAAAHFIPVAVDRYHVERHKTPGGVILPGTVPTRGA